MAIPYRSGDELDHIAAGETAYWRCAQRDAAKGSAWLAGWDKAALEAAQLMAGEDHLIRRGRTVTEALQQGQAAIRALLPAVPTPGQRRTSATAIQLMDEALKLLAGPATAPLRGGSLPDTNPAPASGGAARR